MFFLIGLFLVLSSTFVVVLLLIIGAALCCGCCVLFFLIMLFKIKINAACFGFRIEFICVPQIDASII